MKKYFAFVTLILISCADHYMVEEVAGDSPEMAPASEIDILKEKVRWGDGKACLKLADCYRDGIGVKTDFVNMMNMVTLAADFGAIDRAKDYFGDYPKNNELEFLSNWAKNEADREAIQGAMAIEKGDTLLGRNKIEAAAKQESSLGMLLCCIPSYSGIRHGAVKKIVEIADKVPYVYRMLGNIYSGDEYPGLRDDSLAAYYFQKADQHTCLGTNGARWLLNYYRNGGDLNLSTQDLERLQILAKGAVREGYNE